MVLTEGYDEPRTDCIVVARPTKSRALYTQMVGRGTRRHPEKQDCLIIDVVGASDVHDLVTIPSLFGIEQENRVWDGDDTVTDVLRQQVDEHEAAGRLLATEARLFDKVRRGRLAWVTVHRPGESRRYECGLGRRGGEVVLVEREPDQWRAGWRDADGAKRVLIDAVSLEMAQGVAEDLARKLGATRVAAIDARWRTQRPTLKQRELCTKVNIDIPRGATRGDVAELLDVFFARKRERKRSSA
jgi:hypothetical protein